MSPALPRPIPFRLAPSLPALALALLALPSPAAAEGAPDEGDPIVVTGEGLPLPPGTPAYGAVTIDRDRLTDSAAGRIEDILADVAGFQQFRRSDSRSANPSAQGATLRALGGNASSRTLLLLDGVPQADPFFGYIPYSALAPERLAEARITRGGGTGAFGAGAVAGTIELASAGRAQLPRVAASAFYGSQDATELSAAITPDLGEGFVTLSGRWDRGDGFHTTPRDQRVAATARARYESWSAGLRAVAPIAPDLEVQFRGLLFSDDRTLRFAGADSHSEGQDASIRLVSRGRWQVDLLAYVQARNFSNVVISATSFRKTLDQRNTPSTGYGGKIELRPPVGGAHLLRIGADARLADGEMFEDGFTTGAVTVRRNAGGEQATFGLFVEDDWTIGRLTLTGGARLDHWSIDGGFLTERNAVGMVTNDRQFADRDGWRPSFRAGGLLKLSSAIALRGAGYTGFRLPTLNELYRPFTVFPVTTRANAALGLERLKGVEAGVDLMPAPGVTLAATAFYNRLEGAIANVTIGTSLRERQNVDAVTAKGVELSGSLRLGQVFALASYAYGHSRVDAPGEAFDGLIPAQTPSHAASATLGWRPAPGWNLSGTLRYVGRQFEDDRETDALKDALTVDAVARVPLGKGAFLVGRAENLFDTAVVTRNVAGSIDLGTPRTLWIGIKLER
ncbi:iron complex outermembrane receptor protein [Sphingomonas zeicaulis]|uniref:TonB-dependent receptor plug domain-containing protein n=1 Tax=Sphingomonas zeicaulis TaxID=1632740 RepID=UPI003D1AF6F9